MKQGLYILALLAVCAAISMAQYTKPSVGPAPASKVWKTDASGIPDWRDEASSSGLPAGVIVMWSGTLATVPDGWALCDGNNGTPDLRERFIKGWSAGVNPGNTGGALTHTHTDHASHTHNYTEVLNHTHTVTVTDPGHSHLTQRYPTATGGSTGFTIDTSMSGTLADNTLPTKSATTGITAETANPAGGVAIGTTTGPSATLTHSSNNHEPPYYQLAYIIKL